MRICGESERSASVPVAGQLRDLRANERVIAHAQRSAPDTHRARSEHHVDGAITPGGQACAASGGSDRKIPARRNDEVVERTSKEIVGQSKRLGGACGAHFFCWVSRARRFQHRRRNACTR